MNVEIAEAVTLDEHELRHAGPAGRGCSNFPRRSCARWSTMARWRRSIRRRRHGRSRASWVVVARTAGRLRRDFELDAHSLSVVLRYVQRVEALEAELRALRARLG